METKETLTRTVKNEKLRSRESSVTMHYSETRVLQVQFHKVAMFAKSVKGFADQAPNSSSTLKYF